MALRTRQALADDATFMALVHAICAGDSRAAMSMIRSSRALALRRAREDVFLPPVHWLYRDDTALHIAAAAYRTQVVESLIRAGADVAAANRRGAQALHYACDGVPVSMLWNPSAQAEVITALIEAGADPNAVDKSGVAPIHRAVRTRCASAVSALLEHGADPRLPNRGGSMPLDLARRATGRGGSGSAEARAQQAEIIRILDRHR